MYLIISKDKRVPYDVQNFDYEQWSLEEFIEKASSDDGIDIDSDGGIYINVDSLTKDIYESLREYASYGFEIVYYQFSDQMINLNFPIEEGIVNYEVEEPKKEETQAVKEEEERPVNVQQTQPQIQPQVSAENVVQETEVEKPKQDRYGIGDVDVLDSTANNYDPMKLNRTRMDSLIDEPDTDQKSSTKPAKVIMFGSSKGGTGKTFTCLITAYRFAQTHPNLRIALADFDIIDGQVGININRVTPTMKDFYAQYKAGHDTFTYLNNCSLHNEHFNSNLDFYLAPPMDIPELTEDTDYWQKVFELLILNYDVVFFDTGIDYLGKPPISKLYQIADKIIITCNPSINSVKSIIKQLKTLSGIRRNPVFTPDMKILDRTYVVLTRVYADSEINNIVVGNITKYVDVIAAFGNIDDIISKVQWYQQWELIGNNQRICATLDNIANIDTDDGEL